MRIVCLPGDGIGEEVMREAVRVLELLLPGAAFEHHLLGATAIAPRATRFRPRRSPPAARPTPS